MAFHEGDKNQRTTSCALKYVLNSGRNSVKFMDDKLYDQSVLA